MDDLIDLEDGWYNFPNIRKRAGYGEFYFWFHIKDKKINSVKGNGYEENFFNYNDIENSKWERYRSEFLKQQGEFGKDPIKEVQDHIRNCPLPLKYIENIPKSFYSEKDTEDFNRVQEIFLKHELNKLKRKLEKDGHKFYVKKRLKDRVNGVCFVRLECSCKSKEKRNES